jgi:hypothetical protein
MAVATYRRKKSIMWTGAVASLVATYLLCNLAVQAKWETLWRIAQTEEELRYATVYSSPARFGVETRRSV